MKTLCLWLMLGFIFPILGIVMATNSIMKLDDIEFHLFLFGVDAIVLGFNINTTITILRS